MSNDSSMARDFEEFAQRTNAGPITHAVLGGVPYPEDDDERFRAAVAHRGDVLTWEKARELLLFNYDRGYGGADCPAVYAWTEGWVLFVSEYDGSTHIDGVPRHPISCEPEMA